MATTWTYQPLTPAAAQLQQVIGQIKVWDGAQWVVKPVKVWDGSQWVQKPVKYYNASIATWVTTPY